MATERITINLPPEFDASRHATKLLEKIEAVHGEGFEIEHIDPVKRTATATRSASITEVTESDTTETFDVKLMRGAKPADGDKYAAKLEDQHDGFFMTKYEPYLGRATLSKLDPETARCRGAVSVALGVKPWEVQCRPRTGGGFELELPKGYVPSRHDDKLEEVAVAVVGELGWTVRANTQKLTASIIPGLPPTFETAIPYPFGEPVPQFELDSDEWARIPIGVQLSHDAEIPGKPLALDLEASPHTQVSGTSGSGKAQPLDARIPVPVSARFPDGWATIGDLEAGDKIYGRDGTTTRIVDFSETVAEDIYEVELSDGQVIRTTGGHFWNASPAAARQIHNRHGDRNAATVVRLRTEAGALRAKAAQFEPGDYATAIELAEMAGISLDYARTLARTFGLSVELVTTAVHRPGATVTSTRPVEHWLAEDAFVALGQQGEASLIGQWLSTRSVLEQINGTNVTRDQCHGARQKLRSRGVPSKMLDVAVVRSAGAGNSSVNTYPVGEFLYVAAAALEANIQPGANGEMMLLEHIVTTEDMMASLITADSRQEANWAIRMAAPFDGPDVDLPMDPYILGAWLGDGTSRSGSFTQGTGDTCTKDGVTDQAHLIGQIIAGGYEAAPLPSSPETTVSTKGLSPALRREGLLRNKHIPAGYLRASVGQRLALLQGLMDTDGSIAADGGCELALCNERLATGALELIRSLGIKCAMRPGPATLTEADPDNPGSTRRRDAGIRYRMTFTTTTQVFRLPRKAELIPAVTRKTQDWLYITDIRKVAPAPARCLRIEHHEHLYLTDGFVPTHNSVVINGIISGVLARGAELVVVDLPSKAVDFMWCKDFVRPGGWGCENLAESVTSLALVYEEGERRAKLLAKYEITKWTELPAELGLKPIVVIVDEVTGLFFPEEVPKGLPKDHPLVTVPTEVNMLKATLRSYIARAAAELRFVGVKVLLSSQVSSTTTGVPTAIRMNLGNKMLLGTRPTDNNRKLSLSDAGAVPKVPANVSADDKAGRGVGVAEFEGQVPSVFKGYYASVAEFSSWLTQQGIKKTDRPRPLASEISKHTPSLDDGGDMGDIGGDSAFDSGRGMMDSVKPRQKRAAPKQPAAAGGPTAAAGGGGRGGGSVDEAFRSSEMCGTCGTPIDALTGNCGCSW